MLLTAEGHYQYNPNYHYDLLWRLLATLCLLVGKTETYLHLQLYSLTQLLKLEDILEIFYTIYDYRYSSNFDFAFQTPSE